MLDPDLTLLLLSLIFRFLASLKFQVGIEPDYFSYHQKANSIRNFGYLGEAM